LRAPRGADSPFAVAACVAETRTAETRGAEARGVEARGEEGWDPSLRKDTVLEDARTADPRSKGEALLCGPSFCKDAATPGMQGPSLRNEELPLTAQAEGREEGEDTRIGIEAPFRSGDERTPVGVLRPDVERTEARGDAEDLGRVTCSIGKVWVKKRSQREEREKREEREERGCHNYACISPNPAFTERRNGIQKLRATPSHFSPPHTSRLAHSE
jgi:hypothetical protein